LFLDSTPERRSSWFNNLLKNFSALKKYGFEINPLPRDNDPKNLTCCCFIKIPKQFSLKEDVISVQVDLVVESNEVIISKNYIPIIGEKIIGYSVPSPYVYVSHPFETLVEKVEAIQRRYMKNVTPTVYIYVIIMI